MSDVNVQMASEHAGKSKEELSALLDQEIERFSQFMCRLGDWKAAGPLIPQERALIKTYLVHKLTGKIDEVP